MNLVLSQNCYDDPSCIAVDNDKSTLGLHEEDSTQDEWNEIEIGLEHLALFREAVLAASTDRDFHCSFANIKICNLPYLADGLGTPSGDWRIRIARTDKPYVVAFDNDDAWALVALVDGMLRRASNS